MPHLHRVSEAELRGMARDATSMYLRDTTPLSDAVTKVATAFPHSLTSEHVRRVCEMTYHDVFERSFKGASAGGNRLVAFDPPDATKIAAAIRAARVESYMHKAAQTSQAGVSAEKAASAPSAHIPAAPNAFLRRIRGAGTEEVTKVAKVAGRRILQDAQQDTSDAVERTESDLGICKHADIRAMHELVGAAKYAIKQGSSPESVLAVCGHFLEKDASVPRQVSLDILTELTERILASGVSLEKTASLEGSIPNPAHPLHHRATKVGHLRRRRFSLEFALSDLQGSSARVNRELENALYA